MRLSRVPLFPSADPALLPKQTCACRRPAAVPAETPAPQSSTELPNVETPPSTAEKEKDQQAEELEEECTVATIAAVADCEAVWKKCVMVVKTADC